VELSDEDGRIADHALEEPGEDPHQHASRENGLKRLHRAVLQERPVEELHDGVVNHAQRKRPDELDDVNVRFYGNIIS
jgi:hypothetical protein